MIHAYLLSKSFFKLFGGGIDGTINQSSLRLAWMARKNESTGLIEENSCHRTRISNFCCYSLAGRERSENLIVKEIFLFPGWSCNRTIIATTTNATAYFFVAVASSALAFALFSRTPTNLASLLASRNVRYAFSVPSGISLLLTLLIASSRVMFAIGSARPVFRVIWASFVLSAISSLDESGLLCWPLRRGKRIRRAW